MSGDFATRDELRAADEETRIDTGIAISRAREAWKDELALELKAFKNEIRLLIAVAVLVLKFHIPAELTAAAIGGVGVKALLGLR